MQAPVGVPPIAVPAGWPTLVPGPFVLLFLLPAIPLLLFSIGARPPDTSAFPFSADEIFTTIAFITAAGAVVLAVGVHPDGVKGVLTWVREGVWVEQVDRDSWVKEALGWVGVGTQQQVEYDSRGMRVLSQSVTDHRSRLNPKMAQNFLAAQHTAALRISFRRWYDPSPPNLAILATFTILLIVTLLVSVGQFLSSIYPLEEVLEKNEDEDRSRRKEKEKIGSGDRAERKEKEALERFDKMEEWKKKKKASGKEKEEDKGDDGEKGKNRHLKMENGNAQSNSELEKSGKGRSSEGEGLKKMGLGAISRTAFLGPPGPRRSQGGGPGAGHNAVVFDTPGVEVVPDEVGKMAREHSPSTAEEVARRLEAGRE